MAGRPLTALEGTLVLYYYLLSREGRLTQEAAVRLCARALQALAKACGRQGSPNCRNTGVLYSQFAALASLAQGRRDCYRPLGHYHELLALRQQEASLWQELAAGTLQLLEERELLDLGSGLLPRQQASFPALAGCLLLHFYLSAAAGLLPQEEAAGQCLAALAGLQPGYGGWQGAAGRAALARSWACFAQGRGASSPWTSLLYLQRTFPRLYYSYAETALELAGGA